MPKIAERKNHSLKREIAGALQGLPAGKLLEVRDFVYYVKSKDAYDPAQAYFWTTRWQRRERAAQEDKQAGRIIGDGSVNGLLRALKR